MVNLAGDKKPFRYEDFFTSSPSLAGMREERNIVPKGKKKRNLATKALKYVRQEPYNPDAIDGSTPPNGIVQEGTPWERPAGTRLLNNGAAELARWNRQNPSQPYLGATLGKPRRRRLGPLVADHSRLTVRGAQDDWEEAKRKITKIHTVTTPPVTRGKPIAKAVVRDESKIRGRKGVPQVSNIDHQIMLNHVHDVKARVKKKYGDVSTVEKAKAALQKAYPNLEPQEMVDIFGNEIGLTLNRGGSAKPDGTMHAHTQGLVVALLDHADNHPDVAKSITTINNRTQNDSQAWDGVTAVGPRVDVHGDPVGLSQKLEFKYSPYNPKKYRDWADNPVAIESGDVQMLVDLEAEGVLSFDELSELSEMYLASHEFGHAINNYHMFKDMGIDMAKPWGADQIQGFYDTFAEHPLPFDDAYNTLKQSNPGVSQRALTTYMSTTIWSLVAARQQSDPHGFEAWMNNLLDGHQYDGLTAEERKIASTNMSAISRYAATLPAEEMAEMYATRYLFMSNQAETPKIRKLLDWMKIKAASIKGPKSSGMDWSVKISDTKHKKLTAKELEAIAIPTCRAPDGSPGLVHGLTPADKKGRKPETKTEFAFDIETKAGVRPNLETYNPDAIDGDLDGIVQEGTPWERPAGTRIFTETARGLTHIGDDKKGKPLSASGMSKLKDSKHRQGLRYIDTATGKEDTKFKPGPIHKTQGRIGRTIESYRAGLTQTRTGPRVVHTPNTPHDPTKEHSGMRNGMSSRLSLFSPAQRKLIEEDFKTVTGKSIEDQAARLLKVMEKMPSTEADSHAEWYALRLAEIKIGHAKLEDEFGKDAPGMPTLQTLTGAVAALSVKKMWINPNKGHDGEMPNWDAAMTAAEMFLTNPVITKADIAELRDQKGKPMDPSALGKRLQDLSPHDGGMYIAAGIHDLTNNAQMQNPAIAAFKILKSQDVDKSLAGSKVRSFYSNIINAGNGDALTIDVWMAQMIGEHKKIDDKWLTSGAGVLRATAGLSKEEAAKVRKEWTTKFAYADGKPSTSPVGIYPAFAEVLHQVTDAWNEAHPDRTYTPPQIQAILWEQAFLTDFRKLPKVPAFPSKQKVSK